MCHDWTPGVPDFLGIGTENRQQRTREGVVAAMMEFQLPDVLDFLERYNGMAVGASEPVKVPGEPMPSIHINAACLDRKPEEVRRLTALLLAGRAWRA
jgi:hypothetical protein